MNPYKIGDKVRVLHTDYAGDINVGDIKEVSTTVGNGSINLLSRSGSRLTFYNSEVEPYQETKEMKYNLKVGDVIDTTGAFISAKDDTVEKIEGDSIWLSKTGLWDLDSTLERLQSGKWKLVTKPNMDKIEVGDIVTHNSTGATQYVIIDLGDKDGSSVKLYKVGSTREERCSLKNLKLVSKANKSMKEVIGYNIKPEFKSSSAKIALALDCNDNKSTSVPFYPVSNDTITRKAKDLGVFELWFEPVYKSSEVVVKISNNRTVKLDPTNQQVLLIEQSGEGMSFTQFDGFYKNFIKPVYSTVSTKVKSYKFEISAVKIGCQEFTITDIEAVNTAIKAL